MDISELLLEKHRRQQRHDAIIAILDTFDFNNKVPRTMVLETVFRNLNETKTSEACGEVRDILKNWNVVKIKNRGNFYYKYKGNKQ